MTPDEALKEAIRAGEFAQFEISRHAFERMKQRRVTRWDICLALRSSKVAVPQDQPRKWRIEGGNADDGASLMVVIVFTGRGLVVSVF